MARETVGLNEGSSFVLNQNAALTKKAGLEESREKFFYFVQTLCFLRLQIEVSHLKTERREIQLPSHRSTWGSMGDLGDALPNSRRSISEFDLRLTHRREEKPIAPETGRRNCSFSVPDHVTEIFGKKNVSETLPSEDVQTSVNMTSSQSARSRSFSDLSSLIVRKFQPSGSRRLLNQRELRGSLPSICITPSASDTERSPSLSRKLSPSLGNVDSGGGKESRNCNINPGGQKNKTEKEKKEKEKHQPQGIETEEDVMYQGRIDAVAVTSPALPAMDMQLRDETRVLEGVMNTEVQNGGFRK